MDFPANSLKRGHDHIDSSNNRSCEPLISVEQAKRANSLSSSSVEGLSPDSLHQPARHDSGQPEQTQHEAGTGDRSRASVQVKITCHHCHQRKLKCSGSRPVCRFCSERNLTCTWDGPMEGKALLQVRSACLRCHKRKAKCSGERPNCLFCRERGLECSWDVADGATR